MYRHTQIGSLMLVGAMGSAAAIVAGQRSLPRPIPAVWLVLILALLIVLLFGSLTTEVSQTHFTFWFGLGLIRRSFPLSSIASCTVVVNPWTYGWGIRRTPEGWLYNVSGLRAIELTLHGGKRLRVGSDEPEQLCQAILTMRGGSGSGHG
jgi:hypothetical protein